MRVLLVNTSANTGGAAIACKRLLVALNKTTGVEATLLVRDPDNQKWVVSTTHSPIKRILNFFRFASERLIFLFFERSKAVRFLFSIANTGEDISKHPLVQQADIIHLHWVNGGFLSLKSVAKLFKTKKPIVWTLHDMWLFTGGCHHSGDCNKYTQYCGYCPFLKFPFKYDLSFIIHRNKKNIFQHVNQFHVITCSNWLRLKAAESSLLKGFKIDTIANPINTDVFKPIDFVTCRQQLHLPLQKKYILFAAVNVTNRFKGYHEFLKSLELLNNKYPHLKNVLEILVAGRVKDANAFTNLPFPYRLLGSLTEEKMIVLYNAIDIYVTSSLQENLPNTIMEAMACGKPVVAFQVGGIPEMVNHLQNGYLAEYKNFDDLAKGIYWALFEADYSILSKNAREKVINHYSEQNIALQYYALYRNMIFENKNE